VTAKRPVVFAGTAPATTTGTVYFAHCVPMAGTCALA